MKRLLSYTLCLMMMLCFTLNASASKESRQDQRELKTKIDRESKKTAKGLKKEGWKIMPGALSMERQIMESKLAALREDDEGNRANITASAKAKGGNFNAAKKMAQHQARTELANNISSDLRDIINDTLSNIDLGEDDFETISTFVSANESLSSILLRDVIVAYEVYREQNKFAEVDVNVYISKKLVLDQLRSKMRSSLDEATRKLAERLH